MLGCVKSVYNSQGNNSLTHFSQCDRVKTLSVSSRSDPVTCGGSVQVPLRNNEYIRVKTYACWIWCAKNGSYVKGLLVERDFRVLDAPNMGFC